MKKIWISLMLFLIGIFLINNVTAMANPAAAYCNKLGYEYKIIKNLDANEGVCVVSDSIKFNAIDFYKGKSGKEFSYCAKKGYSLETLVDNFSNEYSACVMTDKGKSSSSFASSPKKIAVSELMGLSSSVDTTKKNKIGLSHEYSGLFTSEFKQNKLGVYYNASNYSYWDWRNPPSGTPYALNNFNFYDSSNGWLTSVKDQGACGGCVSFGVNGAVEAKYEINQNNSRLNPDLSEQHTLSCDNSCYPPPNQAYCQSGCDGNYIDLSLSYMTNSGTPDQSCFPYTATTNSCSNTCSDSSSRLWTLGGVDYSYYWTDFTNQELEQWIIDNGPVPISLYMKDSWSNGYMVCTPVGTSNHAVVLMGYNDTGVNATSYWIIKNSWGTGYGLSGYFKVNFSQGCNVGDEVYNIDQVYTPNLKSSIALNSPFDNSVSKSSIVTFNFSVLNKIYRNSTCDLVINNSIKNTTSLAINGTSTILRYNLSVGNYNWNVNCWENELGIVNSSLARTLIISFIPPNISILSPENRFYNNATLFFNITNSSDAQYLWWNNGTNNLSYLSPFYYNFSEGNHLVYFYANDSGNNVNSTFVNFTIDLTSPRFSANSSSGTLYRYTNFTLNISFTDNYGLGYAWLESNHSGNLVNYSYALNGIGQNLSYSFNLTTLFWQFSYRWLFNDSAGNLNQTSWQTFNVVNTPPANSTIPSLNWTINSNYSINLSQYFLDIDLDDINYTNTSAANISLSINQTTKIATLTPDANWNGTSYIRFIANDSRNITYSNNITLFVFRPNIIANLSIFDGPSTTNFSNLTSFLNISVIIEKNNTGLINFSSVDLNSSVIDLSYVNISFNRIEINSSALPEFNRSAILTFYNLSWILPQILKDNNVCTSCSNLSYNRTLGIFMFNVSGFSVYTTRETPYCGDGSCNNGESCSSCSSDCGACPPSGGGGGGGGGGTISSPISAAELSKGFTKNMVTGEQISFNLGIELHSMSVTGLTPKSITLKILSNPFIVTLNISDEKKLDINQDKYYDFYIKLNSIVSGLANLTIRGINEPINVDNVAQKITNNASSSVNNTIGEDDEKSLAETSLDIRGILIAIVGIILVAGIIIVIIHFTHPHFRE